MSLKDGSGAFFIDDVGALREKLARAERDGSLMGKVWASTRRRVRASPRGFPWFAPFTALVTGEERDLEAARQVIRGYVSALANYPFQMGLQFHYWCFAFPHSRWTLYFQWLDSVGAWDDAEAASLREALIIFEFVNFFYGMRVKPEPECVDNQTMSLCFSNALIGHLFDGGSNLSALAARMKVDGLRRLPAMIGGIPRSGYTGEGSTYMDHVVGTSMPFLVELLERVGGVDCFRKPFEPNGTTPEQVFRMLSRERTPSGLMVPWDHYGFERPIKSSMAYAARRYEDPVFRELLERHTDWADELSVGWGYDDLVWTLLWWPERSRSTAECRAFTSWADDEVGGALASDDESLHLFQMWDYSEPKFPLRQHMNPNSLSLTAFVSPLFVDGVKTKECEAFMYDDTWREHKLSWESIRVNYGQGCAGAHSVLIVDGAEGMRAGSHYRQASLAAFDGGAKILSGDVTPVYREHWPDTRVVRRLSRLCHERFFLVEDLAAFGREHAVAARWFLRPRLLDDRKGITIETAEGVRLMLVPLLGPDEKRIKAIKGYPDRLDGESLQVDFLQKGIVCRWLWLLWPERARKVVNDLSEGWLAIPDSDGRLGFPAAQKAMGGKGMPLSPSMPPFLLADQPLVSRWWYRTVIDAPSDGDWWLRLPKRMGDPALWVNGTEVDLKPYVCLMGHLQPQVAMPKSKAGEKVEIMLRCDCGVEQYEETKKKTASIHAGPRGSVGFSGEPAALVECEPEMPVEWSYSNDQSHRADEQAGLRSPPCLFRKRW